MSFSYMVLGAGRQGIAAAYDLARFGDAKQVTLADVNGEEAKQAAAGVNKLLGRQAADAVALDVRDEAAVGRALKGYDVTLSAVPYFFNLGLTRAAIASGAFWLSSATWVANSTIGVAAMVSVIGAICLPASAFEPSMTCLIVSVAFWPRAA